MISLIDLTGHLYNIIFTFGTGFRNILYLRTSLVIACVLEIIYDTFASDTPLWTPIMWSSAIIAINLFQIYYILYHKKFQNLSTDERKVFNMIGVKMVIINFKKLMKAGIWNSYAENIKIINENEATEKLFYLVDGEVEVKIKDRQIAKIKKENFIGEMSFLSGELPTADVTTLAPAKILNWEKGRLRLLIEKNDDLRQEIHSIFSNDLILKLINQNKQTIILFVILYCTGKMIY